MLPLTCHVPSNRGRQPLTPLNPMTFTYHIARSWRNRPRAIPGLEFRTGTSSVTTTPPRPPSAHIFFSPFLVTTCTRPRSRLTKRTQNVYLAPLPPKRAAGFQTEDTKRERRRRRKKKHGPFLPPSPSFLPSLFPIRADTHVHILSFHGDSVYQGSPAPLSSLIRFLTLAQSFSIFFPLHYVWVWPLWYLP